MIGLQLLAAYFSSPFPLPDKLKNRTLEIGDTNLMNSSSLVLTAWVSKNGSLLRRLDINSSLTNNATEPEHNLIEFQNREHDQ